MDTEPLSMTIVGPPALSGTVLQIGPGRQVLGCDACADLKIDDHRVGARHAAIDRFGGRVVVEDLGSSHGTWVGGERLRGARELHDGEIVTFGRVEVRLEQVDEALPPIRANPRPPPAGSDDRNPDDDYAQQRESFLHEVRTARAWARFVFWVGFGMVLVGVFGCTWFLANGADEPGTASVATAATDEFPAFGPHTVLGPVGTLFFMIGFVGHFVLILGSFLWIIAAAHVRRVDTDPRYPWNSHAAR
ncbi:FHA domain-containing protein [Rhodococcus sp. HM1]|uniref:FHA domain-containing protein n=1 Tax=unclassified Rhodococcus (in: high G+C Gram-positive bacteria) TaxID=192944 RepID=UPI0018CCF66F|nr:MULTISPECIES: FHA domain-containing protein [unclassified Rhodococcus (in: high G+C Gram-positive bacteria)]MBH0119685.1 FHA domain-containing protein [Rhodococcus sp. CX]MCK8675250.1 FHA domain-containing protein [Rhodococcus sp. HM1]